MAHKDYPPAATVGSSQMIGRREHGLPRLLEMCVKRVLLVTSATVAFLALFAGTALAHYCSNASKPSGNGSAGWVLFGPDFGEPLDGEIKLNKNGNIVGGGFFDISIDFTGDGQADLTVPDVFAHAGLPPSALGAAGCEKGVETYVEEFAEFGVEVCPLPS